LLIVRARAWLLELPWQVVFWFSSGLVRRLVWVASLFAAPIAAAQPASDPTAAPAPAPAPVPAPAPALVPVAVPAPPPPAEVVADPLDDTWTIRPGGFIQPQYRLNDYSPTTGYQNGFRFARARFTATGEGHAGNLLLSSYFEAELQPTFSLYDAYVTVKRPLENKAYVAVDFGQTRVPIGRQNMLSDTRLSFVDKAQIGYSPLGLDRDLGARVWFKAPKFVRVIAGVFDGEGRDQVQNINDSYLYAARVEVTPLGGEMPFAESYFDGNWLTVGASVGHNKLNPSTQYHELLTYAGADVSGAWHGLSGSFEYLQVRHTFDGDPAMTPRPYLANGFVAQVAYMPPVELPPFHRARFEIGARVEEYDRDDADPINAAGDPNQSEREWTVAVSYYLRKHTMKIQLAANHYQQIEDKTITGADATYGHDQVLLQVTYRVE
jgi:hypothetical protein